MAARLAQPGSTAIKFFTSASPRPLPHGKARSPAHGPLHFYHNGVAGRVGNKLHLIAVFQLQAAQFANGQIRAVGRAVARAGKRHMRGAAQRFGQIRQGPRPWPAHWEIQTAPRCVQPPGRHAGALCRPPPACRPPAHAHGRQHALAGKRVEIEGSHGHVVADQADIAVTAAHWVQTASLVQKAQQRVAGRARVTAGSLRRR